MIQLPPASRPLRLGVVFEFMREGKAGTTACPALRYGESLPATGRLVSSKPSAAVRTGRLRFWPVRTGEVRPLSNLDLAAGLDRPPPAHTLLAMKIKTLAFAILAAGLSALAAHAASVYDIPLKDIDGKSTSLKAFQGKVVLLVNVASQCGYTKQYKPLEAVYRKYKDRGLVVVGVPSNDFGGQEPGTPEEIKNFCTSKFDVTFPLMEKVKVKPGAGQHPLYAALTGPDAAFPGEVKWNFGKFLIGRDGKVLARFQSADEPDSPQVIKAIETALAAK